MAAPAHRFRRIWGAAQQAQERRASSEEGVLSSRLQNAEHAQQKADKGADEHTDDGSKGGDVAGVSVTAVYFVVVCGGFLTPSSDKFCLQGFGGATFSDERKLF